MCRQCGAPFEAPVEGGTFECSDCKATLVVEERTIKQVRVVDPTIEPGLPPKERQRRRSKSLHQQEENYNEDNPYSFYNAPDGYEFLGGVNELDPEVPAMANQAFRAAVEACEAGGGSLPQQRAVYWVARKLKNIWAQRNQPMRARAVIETAHETVRDPGYLHLLRTSMADFARVEGDFELAQVWLDRCDPEPWMLDLDTSYRTTKALICAYQDDWQGALDQVGERRGLVPYEPSSVAVMSSIRISALEHLGRQAQADSEMTWLIEDSIVPLDFLETMYEGSEIYAGCRTVWERIRPGPVEEAPVPGLGPPPGLHEEADFMAIVRGRSSAEVVSPDNVPEGPTADDAELRRTRDRMIWVFALIAVFIMTVVGIYYYGFAGLK